MKCTKVLSLFSRYLENDIDELTRKKIDQHLMQCVSCGNELLMFSNFMRIIKSAAKIKPPKEYGPH
ncbi:MAG: hypothetical protein VR69_16430 [Peptococcaceae bacterium BRH_c4b]|nr:MAG: hypothetical protein VR69_16430 [Peptococcaceae bacterium BRH_c4b]